MDPVRTLSVHLRAAFQVGVNNPYSQCGNLYPDFTEGLQAHRIRKSCAIPSGQSNIPPQNIYIPQSVAVLLHRGRWELALLTFLRAVPRLGQ